MEATAREKPLVKDLHEHIVCHLCRGYLIDATTLVECLHSFCRGCIVRRLSSGARACPVCGAATLPPLLPDLALQRLVYLTVPGLFRSELERRRHFRLVNPQCPSPVPPLGALDLTVDDPVSLSLRELRLEETTEGSARGKSEEAEATETRYLKCPAGVTVRHLVRLLMLKRGWGEMEGRGSMKTLEMLYETSGKEKGEEEEEEGEEEKKKEKEGEDGEDRGMQVLDLSWSLLDLACIFKWNRKTPMGLFYRVVKKQDAVPVPQLDSYDNKNGSSSSTSGIIENIQRPPTPPPSPKNPPSDIEPPNHHTEPNRPDVPCTMSDSRELKSKKPRCEVTPVMRAPGPPDSCTPETAKPSKVPRLEHHKRRKRRNKRVIAEITTTPREDLLKLKVRLTPCPPRITSGAGHHAKEKLLQGLRAVRRDKIKPPNPERILSPAPSPVQDAVIPSKSKIEPEETIEDIIDGIPDEVVRIAQTMDVQVEPEPPVAAPEKPQQPEEPKNEDILRRLGLVAIGEANKSLQDKMKSSQTNAGMDYHREKLERQLRESKANRVRSLLAEKQMRDALKSIMSKSKVSKGPKKGPPPLAPLTLKSSFASRTSLKNESPLDLSSGAHNALDLSPTPGTSGNERPSGAHPTIAALLSKPAEDRKNQDLNLRTLSDAAVSLLSSGREKTGRVNARGVGPGKVALRIPQPHQRISGFGNGLKIKPNLAVRHIPNPQAFVASQYRNQRANFFNDAQEQAP